MTDKGAIEEQAGLPTESGWIPPGTYKAEEWARCIVPLQRAEKSEGGRGAAGVPMRILLQRITGHKLPRN